MHRRALSLGPLRPFFGCAPLGVNSRSLASGHQLFYVYSIMSGRNRSLGRAEKRLGMFQKNLIDCLQRPNSSLKELNRGLKGIKDTTDYKSTYIQEVKSSKGSISLP